MSELEMRQGETSPAVVIKVTPGDGFIGKVTFSCSGLPSGYVCSFYPQPITLPGQDWTSLTLSPSSGTSAAVRPVQHRSGPLFALITLGLMGFCLLGSVKRRVQILAVLAVIVICLLMLTSCGTGSKPTTGTVTVTATSGAVTQTTQINVTIHQ